MRARVKARPWATSRPVFAALADATRLHLVERLCDEGPLSIVRLTDGARVSRQAVTKHLRVLEGARLVSASRAGRQTVWKLEPRGLAEPMRLLALISREWDERLERLAALVEGKG
jgi:DNA-binding transcriptional ArsR family regulator